MAAEIAISRTEHDHWSTVREALDLLDDESGCNDVSGRLSLLALIYPNLVSPDEADALGISEEFSEAARLSALATATMHEGENQ